MEMKRPPSGKGDNKLDILRLKDGESVTGIVIGGFHTYYAKFNGKYFELSQKGQDGAKFRFRVNFAVKEGAGFTLKVLEFGSMVYEALFELNGEYPLESTPVTIKRKGSTQQNTEYSVLPSAKTKFSKEEAAYLASLTPNDLRLDEEMDQDKFNSI